MFTIRGQYPRWPAHTGDSTCDEVARCLNALTLLNIRNIASEDVLNELMNDYFVTCLIGDDSDTLVGKIVMRIGTRVRGGGGSVSQ